MGYPLGMVLRSAISESSPTSAHGWAWLWSEMAYEEHHGSISGTSRFRFYLLGCMHEACPTNCSPIQLLLLVKPLFIFWALSDECLLDKAKGILLRTKLHSFQLTEIKNASGKVVQKHKVYVLHD